MRVPRNANRASYHHGDARNALLAAASDLLESAGAAGLSLRQVAEAAGLSRQAPYNHFADKEALLAELVRAGFERLGTVMADASENPDAAAALEQAGAAYIAFAQASPALFRLMFSRELVERKRFPVVGSTSQNAFGRLHAIIARLTPAEQVADVALAAWCLVHGYATLCNETDLETPAHRADRAALFRRTILSGAASNTA
jgi:AcrR family transcriptional regulator